MKRFYVIFLSVLFVSLQFSGFSQKRSGAKITAKFDSISIIGSEKEFELITHNKIYNPTSSDVTYRWVVVDVNLPAGWGHAVCDVVNCYSNIDSQTFKLTANDSGLFDIHFYPDGKTGTGIVKVYVYPLGYYNEGVMLYSKCVASNSGSVSGNTRVDFTMYPSPVRDYLNIKFSYKGNHSIEVYNILGRRIIKKDLYNTDRMRLSFENLLSGMYVVIYRSENGKMITKTISKE